MNFLREHLTPKYEKLNTNDPASKAKKFQCSALGY